MPATAIFTPEASFGIIGHPLGHSLSPALHNWVYAELGLQANYQAWPTPPDALADFMQQVRAKRLPGVSVTIPHKQAVIPLLDSICPLAVQCGAVNTLVWEEDKLVGHNTDVTGFLAPLCARGRTPKSTQAGLVLGAGGAARAVLAGLTSLPARPRIYIAARNTDAAEALAEEFDACPLAWAERDTIKAELVVNATPLGMSGSANAAKSPLSPAQFAKITPAKAGCLAYDLVYSPLATPFLKSAQAAGWETQDGLAMLVCQGLEQIRLWTGRNDLPSPEAARAALAAQGLLAPA